MTAAAGGDAGVAAGFDAGVAAGRSGTAGGGSAMTAGTGSIATRGGGSGISSGTVIDERAGLDAHALSARPAAKTVTRVAVLIPNP